MPTQIIEAILQQTVSPSGSPSPVADAGGFPGGAGIVILALLIGGLILMRSRLLRR